MKKLIEYTLVTVLAVAFWPVTLAVIVWMALYQPIDSNGGDV